MQKTIGKVWDPYRLVIRVLKSPFWLLKTIGDICDPQRLAIPIQKSLFWKQKPQIRAGIDRD